MTVNHFLDAVIAQAITAMPNTITAMANAVSATSSTVSDISSLDKKVSDLNSSLSGWNRAYVWALGIALFVGVIALLVAAFSFWAQRQAILTSRELVEANKQLSEEKDRQLQLDLKDKDDHIAATNLGLEQQRERAAIAERSLLELQKLIRAPRWVNHPIAAQILGSGPKGEVDIQSVANNQEASDLTDAIIQALTANGWTIKSQAAGLWASGFPVGVTVQLKGDWGMIPGGKIDPSKLPDPLRTLYNFLKEAVAQPAPPNILADPKAPKDDSLTILIGPKF